MKQKKDGGSWVSTEKKNIIDLFHLEIQVKI